MVLELAQPTVNENRKSVFAIVNLCETPNNFFSDRSVNKLLQGRLCTDLNNFLKYGWAPAHCL